MASYRAVILLMLVVGMAHFNRIAISVAGAERLIPRVQISESRMGYVYSAFLVCYTLAMIPGGWLIDRYGPRLALIGLVFGSAFFTAMCGLVGFLWTDPNFIWLGLLAVRTPMGVVNAPLHPAAARAVFEAVPVRACSFANGSVTFAACVGIASTYYGFGWLIDRFGWPGAFVASALITLLVGVIWTLGTRSMTHARPDEPSMAAAVHSSWTVLRRSGVWRLTLSYAALGYFQYVFFYWTQYYFGTVQNLGSAVSQRYATIITVCMGLGMVLGGWLADRSATFRVRVRRSTVPALGMLASGLVFELGLFNDDPYSILIAFAAAAFLIGACEGAFWTTIVELGAKQGGLAAAIMNTGGNAGGSLSPVVTPLIGGAMTASLGEALGWRVSLAIAGCVPVLGAALWFGIDRDLAQAETLPTNS